jgi:hypothetical protein
MPERPSGKALFIEGKGKRLLFHVTSDSYVPTADVQREFADLSRAAPRDLEFERAFIARKIRTAETHVHLDREQRDAATGKLRAFLPELPKAMKEEMPPPGGVGYGAFYTDLFRSAFASGTVLAIDYLVPTRPGGNVSDYLYLTATNRTAKGVEAFVSYHAQDEFRFRVFDWARDEHWQINIGYDALGDYLTTRSVHGSTYQVLSVQNQTLLTSENTWGNYVWLYNHKRGEYCLVYRYEYTSSEAEQKHGWIGSWGPIVETFQDSYGNVNPLGCSNTYLQARDANMEWSEWSLLSPQQSYIRNDDLGFHVMFLDANHTFAVD